MPNLPTPNTRTKPRNKDKVRPFREEVEMVDPDYKSRDVPGYRFSNGRVFSDSVTRRNRY